MKNVVPFNPVGSFNIDQETFSMSTFKPLGEQSNFWGVITLSEKSPSQFLQKPFMRGMFPLEQIGLKKTPRMNHGHTSSKDRTGFPGFIQ